MACKSVLYMLTPPRIGYHTSLPSFTAAVEADALAFRPLGEKIHSYTRVLRDRASATPNSSAGDRGKDKEKDREREDDGGEQEVEFEVYHVRVFFYFVFFIGFVGCGMWAVDCGC